MKGVKTQKNDEAGAFLIVEAVIIYPIVFLVIFVSIYIGLYLLQLSTLSAYAQKVAILTAREVSYPGYKNLLTEGKYNSSAVEADFKTKSIVKSYEGKVNLSNKTYDTEVRAYRYWYKPLEDNQKTYYQNVLRQLVYKNSILNGKDQSSIKINISCDNYVVAQFINVKVEQKLIEFPLLEFFGIDNPTPSATAVAPVCDTDELIRNTDFIVDSLKVLASKLGINVSKIKSTIKSCLSKLGLVG